MGTKKGDKFFWLLGNYHNNSRNKQNMIKLNKISQTRYYCQKEKEKLLKINDYVQMEVVVELTAAFHVNHKIKIINNINNRLGPYNNIYTYVFFYYY